MPNQTTAPFSYGPGRTRTCDLGIKSPLLYQLSYRPAVDAPDGIRTRATALKGL
jgi:hypothetical protein